MESNISKHGIVGEEKTILKKLRNMTESKLPTARKKGIRLLRIHYKDIKKIPKILSVILGVNISNAKQ